MGAIGFEIWTMQNGILFDNIYIGHSIEDAQKLADETFFQKLPVEKLLELESKPKPEEKKPAASPSDLVFTEDPITYIREKLDLFFTIAQNDPIQAIKFVPEAAGGIAAVAVTLLAVIIGLVSMGGSTPAPPAKKVAGSGKAADSKDKAEAVSSGAEQTKDSATKRSTRSSS
jgi:calnexin